MAWGNGEDVLISKEARRSVLFDGNLTVVQTGTRTVKRRVWTTYIDTNSVAGWAVVRRGNSYEDVVVDTQSLSRSFQEYHRVICDIVTTVTETRGMTEEAATAAAAGATVAGTYSITASVPASSRTQTQYVSEAVDIITTESWNAATSTQTFDECNGTTTLKSAHRANEARGWTLTTTVSAMTPSG